MDYSESMEVVKAAKKLFYDPSNYDLIQMFSRFDEIDDRTSITKFSDDLVMSVPFEDLI